MSTVRRDPRADDPAYDGITGYRTMAEVEAEPPQFTGILADAGLPVPSVGDRYVSTDPREAGRIVTVTRVWNPPIGDRTAVGYEWRDDKPGLCGSACPLPVFLRSYRPEAEPDADAGLSPVLRSLRDVMLRLPTGDRPATAEGALYAARMLLAAHARELAGLLQTRIEQDRADNPGGGDLGRNWTRRGGMLTARSRLNRYADDLDATAADGDQ